MQMPNIEMYQGMGAILALVIVILLLVLWNVQRDHSNHVDLKDLICTNGELDDGKFFRFFAWLVTTWGFVYLILDQRFSEWYFAGYMAAWTGNALVARWLERRDSPRSTPPITPPTPPKTHNRPADTDVL